MKSADLIVAAKNNVESDFEFKFWEVLDDILIENMNEDEEFFTLLLDNDDMKKEIFIEYIDEIYYELKELD